MRTLPTLLFTGFYCLVALPSLQAQVTFTGGGVGDDWSTTPNWAGNVEPVLADNVEFDPGLTAVITQAGEVARVLDVSFDSTVQMLSGDLTLRGLFAGSNGDTGTINFIDGSIDINNNVGGEALELGNSGGGTGTLTMGNGVTNPVLDYSGGRFEVGNANGATALFTLNSGAVTTSNNQTFIIGQGNNTSISTVILNNGSVNTGSGDTNMNDGTSTLTINGGSWSTQDFRFTNNATSTLNLNGGVMTVANIFEDRAGASTLNMAPGASLVFSNSGLREVDDLNASGGTITLNAFSDTFQVFNTADFTGPTEIVLTTSGAGGPTRWIGGTDTWVNGDTTKWESGASPDGAVSAGASFTVFGAGNLLGGANVFTNSPNWATTVVGSDINATTLVSFSGPVLTAYIDSFSSNVTRNAELRMATATGADAAGLNISSGTLSLTGTNELVIGRPGQQGLIMQTGGTITVADDLRFLDSGGTIRLRGGQLNVGGDLLEDSVGVLNAQVYIGGGFLNVGGHIVTQSLRTGETGGFPGDFFLGTGQTVTNTGTFYVGNNAVGFFTCNDGTVITGATIISENTGGQNSEIIVEGGTFYTTGTVDVGRRGDTDGGSFLLAGGGIFTSNGTLRFGNNGGLGTIQVDNANGGGTVVTNSSITTGGTGEGIVSLFDGGTFALGGDPGTRNITHFDQNSGGTLEVRIPADLTITPLNAIGSATVDAGSLLEVGEGFGPGGTTASDTATWIGASGNWDITTNWLASDNVTNLLPGYSSGLTSSPVEVTFLTAPVATILSPSNVTASDGWSVVNPGGNMNELAITRTGGPFGIGPGLAIIANGSTVTRDSDLTISPDGGSGAAGLNIGGGSALEVANAGSNPHMTIGGGSLGTVNQGVLGVSDATAVLIDGDLRFGAFGTQGGTYNLRSGTLTVGGSIVEGLTPGTQNAAVNNAQVQINTEGAGDTNALSVGGTIEVQYFSVAEENSAGSPGNPVTYTLDAPLTTSGGLVIGMGELDGPDYAHGEMIADGTGGAINAGQLILGSQGHLNAVDPLNPNGGSSGSLTLSNNQVLNVTGGRFTIAGENADDFGTTASFTMGGTSTVTVSGSNTEVGRGGTGVFTMNGGTFTQLTNNLVLGQSGAGSGAAADPSSGTVVLGDADGTSMLIVGTAGNGVLNTDLNMNEGFASFTQTGSDSFLVIERDLNMNSGNTNSSSYALTDGNLTVGDDLNARGGNAQDTITFAGSATVNIADGLNLNEGTNNDLIVSGSAATINVGGNAILNASADVQFVLDTTGASPINVAGNVTLGATLAVDVTAANSLYATAHCLPRIDIIGVGGTITGSFSNVAFDAAVPGTAFDDGSEYVLRADASGIYLESSGGINLLDDEDGDGLSNLVEIGNDTDLNDLNSGWEAAPAISSSGGNITISYRQLVSPGVIAYDVETSDDLLAWVSLGAGAATATNPTPSTVLYELTVSMADARKFVRVVVSKP